MVNTFYLTDFSDSVFLALVSQLWKAYQNTEHDQFTIVEVLMQLHGRLFVCLEIKTGQKLIFHGDQLKPHERKTEPRIKA